jgi:Mlc titration factor MtfA (ptsG expression regulator)
VIAGWLARLRAQRERRIVQRRAISDALWLDTLASLPFLARWSAVDLEALRRLTSLFLDQKEACLPVLRLGLQPYRGFVGIVVHADEVVAPREVMDDDGVVHRYHEVLTGEAMEGGPLMLSWTDVHAAGESADWAYNVVIHEFAHVIDMGDGEPDGVPPLPDAAQRQRWRQVIEAEYDTFCRWTDAGRDTVLDPYGATEIGEFFAVAVEAFFVASSDMRAEHPDLYALFAGYFLQDPAVT